MEDIFSDYRDLVLRWHRRTDYSDYDYTRCDSVSFLTKLADDDDDNSDLSDITCKDSLCDISCADAEDGSLDNSDDDDEDDHCSCDDADAEDGSSENNHSGDDDEESVV